ncbi:ATP-dependent acyl-CoA ligase [Ramlibacter monticola]|uniref:ATP-dependent acyl-CoA ligase n=1 Tax=Ramlibacter monticola TaxID=1926872 RepID=A0A936Z5Y4_9BURK|nr:ATP-dependent acyl-CoA ligase [Ramlibacter monticola]MBL0393896.1 ATP-dependent acyl-CoA ligase [Ramlibacter monticola]
MKTEWLLPPAQRTLPALLRRQASRFGERPCVALPGGEWRHGELATVAARRAGALQAAGVQRGDRVAVMCGNRAEFLETVLACGWMGAVAVPVNSASMGPQIEYLLADSGARLLVMENLFVERLRMADLDRTTLESVWVVGEGSSAAGGIEARVRLHAWPAPGEAVEAADVLPSDTLAILYTSGTTGPSKGVLCPHAQYYWWGVHSADVLDLRGDDVLCTTLPLFHVNALNTFAQASVTGCRVQFLEKFSASGFWPAMADSGATVVYLLGAMVPILLAQAPGPAERAHRVRLGLGPGVPEAAGTAFRERTGVPLLEGYGSTETNFVIATRPDSPRQGVMGWVRAGFDARVVDEADNELPPGEAGELVLRADAPFAFATGYFGQPGKTVEAWRNLWFHTGDRVVRDADGAFRFVDRIKDAIRRRGENISSWEVEQVLTMHPAVGAAAVYPVRSELAEDEVMAAVTAREGAMLAPAELAAFCEGRLPRFAIPRFIDIVAELPRTENGKVQKYKLRERGIPPGCWDRGARA